MAVSSSSNDPSQYPGFQPLYQSQSQPAQTDHDAAAPAAAAAANGSGEGSGNYVPRPKRIACVVCRRRKLKCDGKKPSCGTCSRLGHACAYDEVRKKSGPKRGYVKQLEARLAQVENLLNGQEQTASQSQPQENAFDVSIPDNTMSSNFPSIPAIPDDVERCISSGAIATQPQPTGREFLPETGFNMTGNSTWDMLSLGLEEPLPDQNVIDELHQIFFEKIHPSIPIIHRPRYLAASNLTPSLRPPIYLQYIMWCHAAYISDKYNHLSGHFYQRARKYAEMEEMKGLGENTITLAYCQAWLFITTYESKMLQFPRAWLSTGKCARLALMMGLHRLDGAGLNVKQSLPPPKDWTEREERRRVFWMIFCCDRYASIGTSWPMMIDERDILTNLPATEESFIKSSPQRTLRLADVLTGEGNSTLSPLASVVLLAALFGRNLTHLHRPDPQDNDHDLNGEFWKRHRSYDNLLLNIALQLPSHLRLPAGMDDPNIIFSNMCIHTSTICLHQAAIFKAEKNKMPSQMIIESKRRCIVAADQIANIMKLISHMDLTVMNPFLSFCVYVAARIFVQYLKSRPDDHMVQSSLQFVLSALRALKNKNPLTETFLVQLDVDTEGKAFQGVHNPRDCAPGVEVCAPEVAECPAFLGLPDSHSDDAPDISQSRASDPSLTHNPPKRQQTRVQGSNLNTPHTGSDMQAFAGPSHTSNPGLESGAIIDMDAAPNVILNDDNRTPSNHQSPSTLNSLSNTSYSRTEKPSPQRSQQPSPSNTTQLPTQAPMNPLHIPPTGGVTDPSQFGDPSSLARQLNPDTASSFFSTEPGTSFSIPSPSAWNFSNSQAAASGTGDFSSEAQMAQFILDTTWQ